MLNPLPRSAAVLLVLCASAAAAHAEIITNPSSNLAHITAPDSGSDRGEPAARTAVPTTYDFLEHAVASADSGDGAAGRGREPGAFARDYEFAFERGGVRAADADARSLGDDLLDALLSSTERPGPDRPGRPPAEPDGSALPGDGGARPRGPRPPR
jgi:hypothetical protein